MSRWRKVKIGCLSLVGIGLVFLFFGLPYLMVRMLSNAGTRPQDRALTSSPSDYGLSFEDVRFSSFDDVSLSGWYLPGKNDEQAVAGDGGFSVAVGHGLFRSRREVLDRAAFFNRLGANVLVFDFRRHGESEGEAITLGYRERYDFVGAKNYLQTRHPNAPVLYYGVSMGAAAAILAGREDARAGRSGGSTGVAGLIVDSPFLSIEHTVTHHLKQLLGLPRFPFASNVLFFLEYRAGFEREDFDLEQAVEEMQSLPILVIAGGDDRRMPPELQQRLARVSESERSRFQRFDKAGHGRAYLTDPEGYGELVKGFVVGVLPGVSLSSAPNEHAGEDKNLPSR